MKASEIIINKLNRLPNGRASIKQLNSSITNFYFQSKNKKTFWSDHLHKLINEGYSFDLFDILENESFRFTNRKIPKGNARANKLGDSGCDLNTVVGILGYHYYKKSTGNSIYDPTHVIASVLEWAEVAINTRGYIQFVEYDIKSTTVRDIIAHIKNIIDIDISYVDNNHLYRCFSVAEYYSIPQVNFSSNLQPHLKSVPNKSLAILGDSALRLIRVTQSYLQGSDPTAIEDNSQEFENDEYLAKLTLKLELFGYTHIIVDGVEKYHSNEILGEKVLSTLYEAFIGAIYLTLKENQENMEKLEEFISKTIHYENPLSNL